MNLWQKGKRRMLHSVRIRSMKDTSLRLGTPVFLVLMGLVVCLLWGIWENRKLADKYIAADAKVADIFEICNLLVKKMTLK